MITRRNILVHELIGLHVKIVASLSKPYVGIEGDIIDETKNMLTINCMGKVKRIQKKNSIFEFYLPNNETVRIKGDLLINLPENRLKRSIHKLR